MKCLTFWRPITPTLEVGSKIRLGHVVGMLPKLPKLCSMFIGTSNPGRNRGSRTVPGGQLINKHFGSQAKTGDVTYQMGRNAEAYISPHKKF